MINSRTGTWCSRSTMRTNQNRSYILRITPQTEAFISIVRGTIRVGWFRSSRCTCRSYSKPKNQARLRNDAPIAGWQCARTSKRSAQCVTDDRGNLRAARRNLASSQIRPYPSASRWKKETRSDSLTPMIPTALPFSGTDDSPGAKLLSIPIGAFYHKIPEQLLTSKKPDPARLICIATEDLVLDEETREATILLSILSLSCPEIFAHPVESADDIAITFPISQPKDEPAERGLPIGVA